MLPNFITRKVGNKIIFSMLILMTLSSIAVLISTVTKVSKNNLESTKNNLEMLNTAIFQSLRNSMNTGDPAQIKASEDQARKIKGVESLVIAKSKPLIEIYSPESSFTTDKEILKSFKSKHNQTIEIDTDTKHSMRLIKPMIATQECLMCHVNQSIGDVIGVMDLTFSLKQSDEELEAITWDILIWSTILGWITIGIVFYVVNFTMKPLESLKNGFEELIKSNNTDTKLEVTSNDEIGKVASLFNSYMDQVNLGLQQDAVVIAETIDVLEKTAHGFFVYEVRSTASNPHVEELKNNLNNMIKNVKDALDKINMTLRQYSESNYDYKIDDKGIYGDLGSVTAGIKLVGNNTSEILAMILNTGDQLEQSTHALSDSSDMLARSVTEQAESGINTNKSLDALTKTIQENSENAIKMLNFAQDVTTSANNGKTLAKTTSKAMEEIANEVTSINDAITVIDQIAFQTNILSLNAAVEAATAGETGKGFAVVAQEVRNLASRSAEAAKDITAIVEKATKKATQGKDISSNMINGFNKLNDNIEHTMELIDQVSKSSKEQEQSIVKINMDVVRMSRSTKNNSKVSKNISTMSHDIEDMSNRLMTAANKASFLQETRTQVCDVELIYDIAHLKVDLFNYKDDVYARLASITDNKVVKFDKLDQWLDQYSSNNPDSIDQDTMQELHNMNENLYSYLSSLMNASINQAGNTAINNFAKQVEIKTMRIFGVLNKIKEFKCKDLHKKE
jgi:methyl-accepting chemotaxis protein